MAVIIRLLFSPPDALRHRRKKFVNVVHFKRSPQRNNRRKVSALVCEWHKVSEVSNLVDISHSRLRDEETHERWRRCQHTCRHWSKHLWMVTACRIPFEAVPWRSCTIMQGDFGLEQRLGDELSLNLEQSPVSLWKDPCSSLLSAPSALNVVRCSLTTSSLLRLER